MIPKIIHQVHCGEPMDDKVRGWVKSVGLFHPDWTRILWNEEMLEEIGINAATEKAELGSWAAAANSIRLKLLHRFGGIYLDTDVECVGWLDQFAPLDAFAAEQDAGRICNAVMGASRGHGWIQWQLEHFNEFEQKDPAAGVYLATAAPRDLVTTIPQHLVYPFLYSTPNDQRRPHPESVLVHHWAGSWVHK